jgi:hypothetical protein
MTKQSQRQTGSAHIVIIVILILAILGALGFVFWKNIQNKTQPASAPSTSTTKDSTVTQYLDLPYWSVKLQVPEGLDLSNLVYNKTHIAEGPEFYGFTTNRVKAQGGLCDNEAVGSLVILNRSLAKDGYGTSINTDPIDGYYYFLDGTDGGSISDCLKTDIAVQDRLLIDALVKSVSSYKVDTTIHDVDVKMQSSADINQLPSYAPTSFKSYMQQLLANDIAGQGMFDCGTAVIQYQISKISQVNIVGGTVPVNGKGETCSGGAPAIWVLTPAGTWDQETRNGIVCTSKNGGSIYSEFATECYRDANTYVENPNGSILSLGK